MDRTLPTGWYQSNNLRRASCLMCGGQQFQRLGRNPAGAEPWGRLQSCFGLQHYLIYGSSRGSAEIVGNTMVQDI